MKAQNESQNAPKDTNAVAPNVLPVRNSHMPARSCASPPYASASPSTIASPLSAFIRPELNMDRTNVVNANAASPRGPGSAGVHPPDCEPGVVAASRSAFGARCSSRTLSAWPGTCLDPIDIGPPPVLGAFSLPEGYP